MIVAFRKPNPERICPSCGKTFQLKRYFYKGRSEGFRGGKFCSRHCAYEAQRADWSTDKNGYKYCTSNGKMIYEHRVLMERKVGRPLDSRETVHHKNGDRADNRIENLELWDSRHGNGQRLSDKLEHAIHLLSEHGISIPERGSSTWVNGLLSI